MGKKQPKTHPEMIPMASSNVDSIGYHPDARELYVRFRRSDDTYVYSGVDSRVFNELLQAPSKGTYLNSNVKPHYPWKKL